MKAEETIDFPIRWAWHHISRLYNAQAAKYGGSLSLGYVLLNIDSESGTPSTSLGPLLGMEPTSLSRTLKKMEALELIKRQACDNDRRKVFIHLTDLGLEMREASKNIVKTFNQEVQKRIPKKELMQFFQVMEKINYILKNEDIFQNETTHN